ncbi:hypothetical protein [Pseudomonas syringae group genomosp. 3]|uniref:hypothetical protein n=1 Tax=Pseudomonas syringae group genomosp. 3 TaxID=251701 RepID=UPI00190501AC|nr:hypothetical protein [Pseudomonas syringae group genomosp. 3]QQN26307.1 hypothetical protein JHZ65_22075 [Pseudomonas syringae pv. maculicola]
MPKETDVTKHTQRAACVMAVESEIDLEMSKNPLNNFSYQQQIWTLLSVVEDHHFKISILNTLPEQRAAVYVDGLINAIVHPIRACYSDKPNSNSNSNSKKIDREFRDNSYIYTQEWIDLAKSYLNFCSIFPLYHAKMIELTISGNYIVPSDWSSYNLTYEAYDRLVAKRDPKTEKSPLTHISARELRRHMRISGNHYNVNFSKRLMTALSDAYFEGFNNRHNLPDQWNFLTFSISDFRKVFISLQIMASAWFMARVIAVEEGVPALAFSSALWTPKKSMLINIIASHIEIPRTKVSKILDYLTYGNKGIRHPDIAIQPLIELNESQYAISPFIIMHTNGERNLCVLLNQIPEERYIYSRLVQEKEYRVRQEIIKSLEGLGLEFTHGQIDSTDIDLAIIDHSKKTCLCIEIKWFIEPSEIREVLSRSEEIIKGVSQAKKVSEAFRNGNSKLLKLLSINQTYDFLSIVGSVNSIGHHVAQDSNVPVIKIWHLTTQIRNHNNLSATVNWLNLRQYLPTKGIDFIIEKLPITCGKWSSTWYGIRPISNN